MKALHFIILIGFLLPSGCGYHHPSSRPADAGSIAIYAATWENRTNEISLEGILLQKTANWIQQSRLFRLEINPTRADYLLSGTIAAVNNPATAFNRNDRATTLVASVKVTYRLTEQATGRTVWQVDDETRTRNFPAGNDAVRNRSNREDALEIIADELAERMYLKLLTTLSEKKPESAK